MFVKITLSVIHKPETVPVMGICMQLQGRATPLKLNTERAISLVVMTSVTHKGVLWLDGLLYSFLIPASCSYGHGKPNAWVLPPKCKTWVEFLADGFSTAQFQPLMTSGESIRGWELSHFSFSFL